MANTKRNLEDEIARLERKLELAQTQLAAEIDHAERGWSGYRKAVLAKVEAERKLAAVQAALEPEPKPRMFEIRPVIDPETQELLGHILRPEDSERWTILDENNAEHREALEKHRRAEAWASPLRPFPAHWIY